MGKKYLKVKRILKDDGIEYQVSYKLFLGVGTTQYFDTIGSAAKFIAEKIETDQKYDYKLVEGFDIIYSRNFNDLVELMREYKTKKMRG